MVIHPSPDFSTTTGVWQPSLSYALSPATPIEPNSIHVFFGTSYGPHRPLSHASIRENDSLGVRPAVRIQSAPLSSNADLGRSIKRQMVTRGLSSGSQTRTVQQSLSGVLRGGAFRAVGKRFLDGLSRNMIKVLPEKVYQKLLVGTHERIEGISRLLIWDKYPLHRIGLESKFSESGSHSCTIPNCICHQGLLINRWVYETLFNERTGDAVSQFV